jgi:thioredoxin-related protein
VKKKLLTLFVFTFIGMFGTTQSVEAFDFFGLFGGDAKKLKKKAEKSLKKYTKLLKGKKSKKKKKKGSKKKKGKPTEKGKKGNKLMYVDNIDTGMEQAKKSKRKILIIISSENCPPCKAMKKNVYTDKAVKKQMKKYVIVTDGDTSGVKGHAKNAYYGSQGSKLEGEPGMYYTPTFGIFDAKGKFIKKNIGSMDKQGFLNFLK